MIKSPNTYLYRNNLPGILHVYGPFQEDEEEALLYQLSRMTSFPKWGLLSLLFPGRNGMQLERKYRHLVSQGKTEDLSHKNWIKVVPIPARFPAFFVEDEIALRDILIAKFRNQEAVSTRDVHLLALELWNNPEVLARNVAYQRFLRQRLPFRNDQDQLSQEFISAFNELEAEARRITTPAFIEAHGLIDFQASRYWIHEFLERQKLSIRKFHARRRCTLDPGFVRIYLNQLVEAVHTYGWDKIFNMDETSVLIDNSSHTTIAPTGEHDVVCQTVLNDKECFTAIGTCTKRRILPLVILAKGVGLGCEKKFHSDDDVITMHSANGWTDESIMIQYLRWLHKQAGGPCALVLYLFKAHQTVLVKATAEEFGIQLIYVTANGTGDYQPLDRTIFGVLKARLRCAPQPTDGSIVRYGLVTHQLESCWERTRVELLEKAWAIPGLPEDCLNC